MFDICLQNGISYRVGFAYDYKDSHPVATHCIVRNLNNNKIIKGSAFCNPCDQFSKSLGRKLALQRALCWWSDKFDRTMFWQAYWEALYQG
jgi:hypothetical protein